MKKEDHDTQEQTWKKEPVTLPESEENTINLIQTGGKQYTEIKPKVYKRFDYTIKGPRIIFKEIISPDDIMRKREKQIYDLRNS